MTPRDIKDRYDIKTCHDAKKFIMTFVLPRGLQIGLALLANGFTLLNKYV